jgi:hypothetical protein
MGLIQVLLVLAIVAVSGAVLMRYVRSSVGTVETLQADQPLARAKLAADQATAVTIQGAVRAYQAEHGQWPADKATVLTILAAPPRFQCAGNDFEYDGAGGTLRLLVTDPGRC